ncbi:helix-turn-helix transcriptional regulator [Cognatishimia sp.]|uniref:helix-turn-helix transcriptional regulator n=1 Tax=Cognatishimia sp. TaxID=2211648 RepID=UPI0035147075
MPNAKRLITVVGLAMFLGVLMLAEEAIEVFGFHAPEDLFILEVLEIIVLVALILCIALAAFEGLRMWKYQKTLEFKVSRAAHAFQDMLDAHFEKWDFTGAERDVTRLILKGCSIAEIAEIRDAKQGTVKAQTNSIYKKSGYAGKAQLLSAFLEELTDGASVK